MRTMTDLDICRSLFLNDISRARVVHSLFLYDISRARDVRSLLLNDIWEFDYEGKSGPPKTFVSPSLHCKYEVLYFRYLYIQYGTRCCKHRLVQTYSSTRYLLVHSATLLYANVIRIIRKNIL